MRGVPAVFQSAPPPIATDSRKQKQANMTDADDEEIDDEQVEDYCTMLDKLGRHPDKVAIVSLSRISARLQDEARGC